MTNTEIELDLCTDCVLVIANDDRSGVADPEAHDAGLRERWGAGTHRLVVLSCDGDDTDPCAPSGSCDGCGREQTLTGKGVAVAP